MRNFLNKSLCLALGMSVGGVLLAGCSVPEPKPLVLAPSVKSLALSSQVGHQQLVGVNAVDARVTKKVGDYGPNESLRADVTVDELGTQLTQVFKQGLQSKGFKPVAMTSQSKSTLLVSLTSLGVQAQTARMDSKQELKASVSVEAVNGDTTMTKQYEASEASKGQMLSEEDRNHIQVDSVLSDVVTKVLEDDELMMFLAR